AISSDWEQAAREEERRNPRYAWLGDLPHEEAMYLLSGSRYLVLSSLMEGGASVIAEAVACGIPVLCSKIPGNIGMLGADYWGYFSPRGLGELAEMLGLLESTPSTHEDLRQHILTLQPRFSPTQEPTSWRRLLAALCSKVRHWWKRRRLPSKPKNLSAFRCHSTRECALLRPRIRRITLFGIRGRRPQYH